MSADPSPQPTASEIVIQGVTEAGRTFRPGDWAERLCGVMSVFSEDRHLSYSPYLKPVVAEGLHCVVVDCKLEAIDPAAFRFLLDFARDNELRTRPGRDGTSPAVGTAHVERRHPEPQREGVS